MAPHSNTLAWKISWTEEPGRLQSMGLLRVRHDWATWLSLFTFMHWRRKWQPTPVFLLGESQGQWSLVGCRLWDRTEPDILECKIKWALGNITTNKASGGDGIPGELFQILTNGGVKMLHSICQQRRQCTPLQYSCLENPMDRGAWCAAVHGVARVGHNWASSLSCIGEGNGNPFQCSCLENPRDSGAWWAAVYGVAQSWTRLKWLSSSIW